MDKNMTGTDFEYKEFLKNSHKDTILCPKNTNDGKSYIGENSYMSYKKDKLENKEMTIPEYKKILAESSKKLNRNTKPFMEETHNDWKFHMRLRISYKLKNLIDYLLDLYIRVLPYDYNKKDIITMNESKKGE